MERGDGGVEDVKLERPAKSLKSVRGSSSRCKEGSHSRLNMVSALLYECCLAKLRQGESAQKLVPVACTLGDHSTMIWL